MNNNFRHIGIALVSVSIVLAAVACKEESSNPAPTGADPGPNTQQTQCSEHVTFFEDDVWPILKSKCFTCHEIDKVTSALNLVGENFTDHININFSNVKNVSAKQDAQGRSSLLTKPANLNNDHSGGQRFTVESPEYAVFNDFVGRMNVCVDQTVTQQGLVLDGPQQRLRKLTLSLASRLPTQAERQAVGDALNDSELTLALNNVADQLMTEGAFFTRLKEMYNDLLLLDAFPGTAGINTFDLNNFTNKDYFDTTPIDNQGYSAADRNTIRANANAGLVNAPLELIEHVVRNSRPISEILTADYLLVNPYSATIFNANVDSNPDFNFKYGDTATQHNANDFREAKITDMNGRVYPHAGILSTLTFLRRYPSTNTNINRARSRYVFEYFLDTDVQGLADRAGLDLDNVIGRFPTLEDPQCKQCHDTVDPVAGLFKNWTNNGQYRGDFQNWFSERNPPQMLRPGYTKDSADELPSEYNAKALQWLAQRVVADSRFATATVKTVYKGVTGQTIPADILFTEELKGVLVDSNFNLKTLIKAIISSDYFTAQNLSADAQSQDFAEFGMAHLLTPEQLHRKIRALFPGYTWRSPSNRALVDRTTYLLMYGGIDSVDIIERTTEPTALITGIQERIAMEVSCDYVPQDLNVPQSERVLFPIVEISDTPDTELGKLKIKQNLQFLHDYLLGESLVLDDVELQRSYDLFTAIRDMTPSTDISVDCDTNLNATNPVRKDIDRTVRPWMSVVTYLLMDYRFLYE